MSVTYAFLSSDPPMTEAERAGYLARQRGCVPTADELGPRQHFFRPGPVNYHSNQVRGWRNPVRWCLTCGKPEQGGAL